MGALLRKSLEINGLQADPSLLREWEGGERGFSDIDGRLVDLEAIWLGWGYRVII
jgi:hypothetical protein